MINRVVHIALGKANPMKMNGVNKVIYQLLSSQSEVMQTEFWGITVNPIHNYPKRNFKTRLFKKKVHRFSLDKRLVKAIKTINKENTIIHIHGGFIPENYMIFRLVNKIGIKYFFTPHGAFNSIALKKSSFRKRIYLNVFENILIKYAGGIQVLGDSEKEAFEKNIKTEKLHLIPNGQEIKEYNLKDKKSKKLNLCFLGRIDIHTKGLDLILAGIETLRNENISLSIIGDGGEIEDLKNLVKEKNLDSIIKFEGALFGTEKMSFLCKADALVLLSRNEGLPGVVLEAASVKVPSIISKGTNLKSFITKYNAGYCIDSNNLSDITKTFLKVIADKKNNTLSEKGENAYTMVKKDFDWKKITTKLLKAYDS